MVKNDEHQFESDIEAVMTGELGWEKATEKGYLKTREKALDLGVLVKFVKATQPKEWAAFSHYCGDEGVEEKFYNKFEDAVAVSVNSKGLARVIE